MNWDSEWKLPEGLKVEPNWLENIPDIKKATIGVDLASGPSKTAIHTLDGRLIGCAVRLRIPIDRFNTFELEAWQVGDLVVHEAFPQHKIDRVTHVPTLACFSSAIPSGSWTNVELIDWCERVQQVHEEDWAVLRALTPLTYEAEIAYEAKLRIREWCLSVEVGEQQKGEWK